MANKKKSVQSARAKSNVICEALDKKTVEELKEVIEESAPVVEKNVEEHTTFEKEAAATFCYVINGKLNLRSQPNAQSSVLCILDQGSKLQIVSSNNDLGDFCKVSFTKSNDSVLYGFVMKKFVEVK